MSDPRQPDEIPHDHALGGGEDAFLYAVAKQPTGYTILSEDERTALKVWFAGTATASEIEQAQAAVRQNIAAKELLLSMHLQQAVAASPPVPARLSRAILRRAGYGHRWIIRDLLHLPTLGRWQLAGLGAAVTAAVVLTVGLYPSNQGGAQRFQVAALSDRSVLGEAGASVVRGLSAQTGRTPVGTTAALGRAFIEVDVPKPILQALFGISQQPTARPTDPAVAAAARALLQVQDEPFPVLIFDRDLEALIRSGKAAEIVVVRVYDLSNQANLVIAQDLKWAQGLPWVFITAAP